MDVTENPLRVEEVSKAVITASSVPVVLAACPREVRDCLEGARGGAELSFEQGLLLATAEGESLHALVGHFPISALYVHSDPMLTFVVLWASLVQSTMR
jgi:hypothetical protein